MKTILVPTDFSKNANNALDYAIKLAEKENAKIILLHAFHVTYIYPDVPMQYLNEQIESAEEIANKQLKLLCEKVEKSKILECEFINKESSAVDFILETITKRKPDLVVMGTKGASGIEEMLVGSNTAKVVEKAKCPVIAIPENATFSSIENITYATDYFTSDINAVEKLVEIAKLFNAKITLLHVCFEVYTHDAEEEFMDTFKNKVINEIPYNKLAFKLVYGKNLIDVLEDYVKHESPDLLSMSTDYKNLFDKFFGTNSTKKMTYNTKVPLLAFHYKHIPVVF
jgi:nucleotide-binding universal stress UspA family protein